MAELGFRQQILMSLLLMPVMFGLWYAAGALLAGPAGWLAGQALVALLPGAVAETGLDGTTFVVVTEFGRIAEQIVSAEQAGHELVLEFNTRLLSYSIPFYAALLWGSRVDEPTQRFAWGLFVLWCLMALGIIAVAAKDLMLLAGDVFLTQAGVPPAPVVAVAYQFSVLLMPSLAPVLLWLWQLRGTPLWQQLADHLNRASARNKTQA